MALTSIISVNYNQPLVTLEFLKSVKRNTIGEDVELILVDNGSHMDYGETFKSIYPELIYIRSKENLGFAGGNNLGIEKSQGEFLLFLNNDTELTENFVGTLMSEFIQNPNIGLLSPLILYHEDKTKIQYAGYTEMNYLTGRNKTIGSLESDNNQFLDKSEETGFVHGAAMMCKRIDLESVGLMEENYFLYYEEMDWCEKFRKAGKKIWFTGKAKIYHKESISVGKDSSLKIYFMFRNRMLFIRKNTNLLNTAVFGLYYIGLVCPGTALKYLLNGRKDLIPWIFQGLIWNCFNSKTSMNLGYKLF